jgi:hypothetical protein
LGVVFALFVCALAWPSDGRAACGQHPVSPRRHAMTAVAHFEYASLIFGPDSASDLVSSSAPGAFSCPGRGGSDSPSSTFSVPLRVEPWLLPASVTSVDPSSRPLLAVEDRDRPRVHSAPIDRPPKGLATV